jgi:DNA-binding transcriptional MerR regulator
MAKPDTVREVAEEHGYLRIGELARRAGVTPAVLRTWEKRYGLLSPARSSGGLRLYSERDEALLRRMRDQLRAGLSTAEAARVAKRLGGESQHRRPDSSIAPDRIAGDLRAALDAFDDAAAHAVLDRLFAAYGLETAFQAVLLPYLRELGERWADGDATVVEEHFASNLIRGRLHAFARGWDHGRGPAALLACPAGELHDLPLLCFGIVLRGRGWRITYLGADTPIRAIAATARAAPPTVVVLAAVTPERFSVAAEDIRILAQDVRVALGGVGASEALARRLGAELLPNDVVVAAGAIAP